MSGDPSLNPPSITAQRLLHQGKKFDLVRLTVRRGGTAGGTVEREIVRHPGAVVVVPILADKQSPGHPPSVVLIRNFRIALGRGGEHLLECCAGTIERPRLGDGSFAPEAAGEDPESCAARELVEETGYEAATLHPLGWFYTTPGLTDEKMHAFAATGLTHVGQRLEEDETIEVVRVGGAEARAMALDGRIRDAKSIVALSLAARQGFL